VVDYVQVSYANDDSFEWFGGSVNCKHLISFRTLDDDFDTDNGYSGKVQFGISLRDSAIADISKSEAFESDNDANGSDRKTFLPSIAVSANNPVAIAPVKTNAVFSNMTVMGPKVTSASIGNSLFNCGAQIRRNSEISIVNSLFLGWSEDKVKGLLIDGSKGTPTDLNLAPAGGLNFENNVIGLSVSNLDNINVNDKIKLVNHENLTNYLGVICEMSGNYIKVKLESNINSMKLLVYGTYVSDLKSLNYNSIFSLSVGAIKQLNDENKLLREKLNHLENMLNTLLSK
jgi:hypothetical protein